MTNKVREIIKKAYSLFNSNREHAACTLEEEEVIKYKSLPTDKSLIYRILDYFEQSKPYINPNFKITDIAKTLATNRSYVSRSINGAFSMNFSQLCNYFRVVYACQLYLASLADGVEEDFIKLRQKVGFKSYSSFLCAFNMHTGLSPAKWGRIVKERVENKQKISVFDYMKRIGVGGRDEEHKLY